MYRQVLETNYSYVHLIISNTKQIESTRGWVQGLMLWFQQVWLNSYWPRHGDTTYLFKYRDFPNTHVQNPGIE